MRHLWLLLAALVLLPCAGAQNGPRLNLVIVQGDGAINNIRQRTAREPIVQVEDENHKPVAGAAVVFMLPSHGASGTFANGSRTLTVVTDNQGQAVAHGLQANRIQGQFQIHVNASYQGQTASATISESNVAGAGTAGAGAGISAKLIIIIAVAAAAGTIGGLYASHTIGGGGSSTPAVIPSGLSITPGTGSVGPPR